MTSNPSREESHQTSLANQFAAPNLWRNNILSPAEQVKFKAVLQSNPWTQHIAPPLMGLDTIPLYNDHYSEDRPAFKQKARFYSDKLIIYPVALNPRPKEDQPKKCLTNLTRGKFNGFISKNSGLTIRKRLEAWIKAVNTNTRFYKGIGTPKHKRIVFITLTLPSDQVHTDNEIKRSVLMPFIQQIKRVCLVEENFWAAEPQESGNVHFHLLVDRFINKQLLNDLWNSATNNLGYLDRYIQKTGGCNPPSTRINECPENMSLVKYVLKYVSKQPRINYSYCSIADRKEHGVEYFEKEEIKGGLSEIEARGLKFELNDIDPDEPVYNGKLTKTGTSWFRWYSRRKIEGRSWGMSKGISQLDIFSQDVSYRIRDIRSILEWDSSVKFVQKDHCEIFYCNVADLLMRNDPKLLKDYEQHYLNIYAELYLPQKEKTPGSVPIYSLESFKKHRPPEFKQTSFISSFPVTAIR